MNLGKMGVGVVGEWVGVEGGFGEGVLEGYAPYMGVGCRVKVFFWGFLFHALMFNFRVSDNFLDTFYNNPDLAPILTQWKGLRNPE